MATGFVKESALTAEVANQPIQATPGCAFLFFLAQPPDAPELRCPIYMRVLLFVLSWTIISVSSPAADASKSRYEAGARSQLELLSRSQTNVQFLLSLTNLPASVREKLGETADIGQPYADGCVGRPHRRFLAATKAEGTYTVAFEQGGFIPTWYLWQFLVDAGGKVIQDRKIEPADAANRSQPAGSETNRTSAAAGSGR